MVTSLAFFLPAYNEASNFPLQVEKLQAYGQSGAPLDLTIIVVDDGSSDSTKEVLSAMSGVTPVFHESNQGYGAALRSGLSAGIATGHAWIAFCDSDGQFDPADVATLIAAAEHSSADVVLGIRERRADNFKRRLMGRAWHWLSSQLLGFHAQDVDCGFKLFRREAIESVLPHLAGEYAMISPELITRLQRRGYKITEVNVPHYARQHGVQTGASLGVVLKSLYGIFKLRKLIMREEVTYVTSTRNTPFEAAI